MKPERHGINPDVPPSGEGCVECLATGGWWLHLRRCAECGHIGCCDSSPGHHASKHFHDTGHPIAAGFEPGEIRFWDFRNCKTVHGEKLAEPRWPALQPTPGPAGRATRDWVPRIR